jgi:hypothetical protein
VRTETAHSNTPWSCYDEISQEFIELVFGMDVQEFAMKFEAFSLFRLKGMFFLAFLWC